MVSTTNHYQTYRSLGEKLGTTQFYGDCISGSLFHKSPWAKGLGGVKLLIESECIDYLSVRSGAKHVQQPVSGPLRTTKRRLLKQTLGLLKQLVCIHCFRDRVGPTLV